MANTNNAHLGLLRRALGITMLGVLLAGPSLAQTASRNEGREIAAADVKRTLPPPSLPARSLQPGKPPSLSLSPAVVMTKGSFGQSVSQTLTLSNNTPYQLSFDMMAEDVAVEKGKRLYVPAGQMPGSIAATAVFSAKSVVVEPYATGSVEVRFTIPPGSPLRAVVALFRGTNRIQTNAGGVAMTASLGTLVTFNLSDNIRLNAEPLKAIGQTDATNVIFSQWLTNTGQEPVVADGLVAVLNESGALMSKAPLIAQRLLPGERLEFKGECPSPLAPGRYRALASYKVEGQTITKVSEFTVR